MTVVPLRSQATQLPPVAEPSRSRPGTAAFDGVLQKQRNAGAASRTVTVQPGDTLSELVAMQLQQTGQPVTARAVYTRVEEIARANKLADADRIYPGQQLTLTGETTALASPVAAGRQTALAEQVREQAMATLLGQGGDSLATRVFELMRPVPGRVTSPYGMRVHPIDGVRKMHTGMDIAAPLGTPVRSAAAGVVQSAGVQGGYGNMVVLQHTDGRETRYAHLQEINVRPGQAVEPGVPLGTVGSTGHSTGPHLHFELREEGRPVDPRRYLSQPVQYAGADRTEPVAG